MTKVGIYLRAEPAMGGTLQYNLAVLAALQTLPRDEFQVVAAFSNDYWREKIPEFDFDTIHLGDSLVSRASAELWGRLRLPLSLWRALAPVLHPLTRRLRREHCDVWLFPSQDSMSFWLPVRSLCSVHDLMHRYERSFPESGSPAEYRGREHLYRNISRWTQGVLVDSETGRRHMHESYGTAMDKLHALPFIPPDYIHREVTASDREELRAKYGLPERFFFYPAQFWLHKNHDRLVRALGRNVAAYPDMKLVFSGGRKNNYADCMRLIDRLGLAGHITVTDYIPDDDMAVMYHCAHALLMPTFYGPTNIPPLEAMACGCPAAVSRIYGMPEQLGDAALYFDPESVEEIAVVMERLWTDDALRQSCIQRGHAKTAAWGLPEFSARLGSILRRVATPGPGG